MSESRAELLSGAQGEFRRDMPSARIESVIHEPLHFRTKLKRSQLAINSPGLLPQ
jgi:hypothetical protein